MRKFSLLRTVKSGVKTTLALGAVGMLFAAQAQAGDPACGSCGSYEPLCCDKVFQDAGCKLNNDLARLTAECCTPTCDPCGDVCGEGCGACADDCGWCNLGDPWDLGDAVFGADSRTDIGGWVQMGYYNESTGLFNDIPDRFNFSQVWMFIERVADGSEGFDYGYRADIMYGTDGDKTQAFGNNPDRFDFGTMDQGGGYEWAIPQLYAEFAYGDLSVKAGHFFTLLGYEVVPAPDNFFYSHAYTMFNSEAFTHTGVLATYAASDETTIYGGWTLGWDTGFDQFGAGNSFLGGISQSLTDDLSLTYILTAGDFGVLGDDAYSHSIVLDWAINDKLNYVFQSDLLDANEFDIETIGANQYLFYNINDCLAVGTRTEWWKANGLSSYSWTAGVNVRPTANLVIRPEVRYLWTPHEGAYNAGFGNGYDPVVFNDWSFGVDAILTF